jgi:hypothetical protein
MPIFEEGGNDKLFQLEGESPNFSTTVQAGLLE